MTKEAALRSERAKLTSGGETKKEGTRNPKESFEPPPLIDVVFTYISYAVLVVFGYFADFWRRLGFKRDEKEKVGFIEVSVSVLMRHATILELDHVGFKLGSRVPIKHHPVLYHQIYKTTPLQTSYSL